MPNGPEMQIQVDKTEAGKELAINDKQDVKTINDFLGKSNKDAGIKTVLESKKGDRKAEATKLSIDDGVLNAYDNLKNNTENRIKFLNYKDMPVEDTGFLTINTNEDVLSDTEKSSVETNMKSILEGVSNGKYIVDNIFLNARESLVPSKKFPNPGELAAQRGKLTKAYLEELANKYLNGDKDKVADFMSKVKVNTSRGLVPYAGEKPGTPEYNAKYQKDEGVNIRIDYKEKVLDPSVEGVTVRVVIAKESELYNKLEKLGQIQTSNASANTTTYNKWNYYEGFTRIGQDGNMQGGPATGELAPRFKASDDGSFMKKTLQTWDPIVDNPNNANKKKEAQKPAFFLSLNASDPNDQKLIADYQSDKLKSVDGMKTLLNAYINQQGQYYDEKINNLTPPLSALNITQFTSVHDYDNLSALLDEELAAQEDPTIQKNISSVKDQLYAMKLFVNNVTMAEDILHKLG